MIIYNVTVNVDTDVADEWLKWMIDIHIPDVMKTGLFTDNHILRLIGEEKSGGISYAVQYTCENISIYEQYRDHHSKALQADHERKFKDKYVAFRTLLEVIK